VLSVPTLFIVIFANFSLFAFSWLLLTRSYPNLAVVRSFAAATMVAAASAGLLFTRGRVDPVVTVLLTNGGMVLAMGITWIGVRRFHDLEGGWRFVLALTGITGALLAYFVTVDDDMRMRIVILDTAQSILLLLSVVELMRGAQRGRRIGAALAAGAMMLAFLILTLRTIGTLAHIDGDLQFVTLNNFQASLIVMLAFAGMTWNVGFILMVIERLRAEVANLALFDDLTGAANRRQLLRRLDEECAISHRTALTFAVLAIDLDGFKAINDSHGHGAGDDCLRRFTNASQLLLRPGDLLARMGGDEFCVVLPGTTLREATIMARQLVAMSRELIIPCDGVQVKIAASIGIAQWTRDIGLNADQLLARADRALYAAKKSGKDRFVPYREPEALAEPVTEPHRLSA
jgi:diguanylate cyclase (GGDEF)-like protein